MQLKFSSLTTRSPSVEQESRFLKLPLGTQQGCSKLGSKSNCAFP
jgi:hypothetical protein